MSDLGISNQTPTSTDNYVNNVDQTYDTTQPSTWDLLISTIKQALPQMIGDVNQDISDLNDSIYQHSLELKAAQDAGDTDTANALRDTIDQEVNEVTAKMNDLTLLGSISDRLNNTDPSDDQSAVDDFSNYQQTHQS